MTRNFSRKGKTYLYGNKYLEQKFILFLRQWFLMPFNVETPVHLIKWGGELRFADQLDRDYELWEYNAHPYQTFFYDFYNSLRQEQMENKALRENGEEPMEDQILRVATERIERERETSGREVDRMRQADIFMQAIRESNAARSGQSEGEGAFGDFLDVRRPSIMPTSTLTH